MRWNLLAVLTAGVLLSIATTAHADLTPKKPNVLFILADDLGYGDLGVTYQDQRAKSGKPAFDTPNLDSLAAGGTVLHSHYTGAPVCAPARASLILGMSQGHCPVRDNQFDKPIPADRLTLASVLHEAGYRTAVIGKWGLGGKPGKGYPAHPMKRGFDDFFGFMMHGTGHVYYHDAKHPLMDGTDDVKDKYENVYSTDLFTARAKKFITDQHAAHPDQPFFLYLAYTAIHNALDVPGQPYPKGGGTTGGLQWPLKPTPDTRNTYVYPEYARQSGWTEPMKRYATMARRLDDGIGDVVQLLKDLKIDKDTLVVFTSDNGPANEGGADPRLFDSWGPFDGFKRDCFEGGVREPAIVYWPGHVVAKKVEQTPTAFWDWMPTLAELSGVPIPAQTDGVSLLPVLLGSDKLHPQRDYLYIEYFNGGQNKASADVFARKGVTGRGQQQLVRIGDYVGVRTQIKSAEDPIRLYDVAKDPHEDHNLAKDPSKRALITQMQHLMLTSRTPDADAERPYDGAAMPAVEAPTESGKGQLTVKSFDGKWPWTPDFRTIPSPTVGHSAGVTLAGQKDTSRTFGLSFTGYLNAPADGQYTFTPAADGPVELWIHDAHVIQAGQTTAAVTLKAGLHPFRLAYRHESGTPSVVLKWKGPGIDEQPVPASAFSTEK